MLTTPNLPITSVLFYKILFSGSSRVQFLFLIHFTLAHCGYSFCGLEKCSFFLQGIFRFAFMVFGFHKKIFMQLETSKIHLRYSSVCVYLQECYQEMVLFRFYFSNFIAFDELYDAVWCNEQFDAVEHFQTSWLLDIFSLACFQ